tara:strand:- start:1799 stop:3046 length:1248 start_codon:yes stop_codon:yes gene_type:complete
MAWYDDILNKAKGMVPENTNVFGAGPNTNLDIYKAAGLLSQDDIEKANKQSMFQGLLSTGLGYLAQPKNQNYGSFAPYAAKALMAGSASAQNPYKTLEKSAATRLSLSPKLSQLVVGDFLITTDQFGKEVSREKIDIKEKDRLQLDFNREKDLRDEEQTNRRFEISEQREDRMERQNLESNKLSRERLDQARDESKATNERILKKLDISNEAAKAGRIPAGYRLKEDGSGDMEAVPGGPADQKLTGKGDAARNLDGLIKSVQNDYEALNDVKGVVNTGNTAMENITASFQSSLVGQEIGTWVGSKEQSIRQKIENKKPLLIAAIKAATGMSSREMDSNRELQFYLQAATDTKKSLEANLGALETLKQLYVDGKYDPNKYNTNPEQGSESVQNTLGGNVDMDEVAKILNDRQRGNR